MKIVTSNGFEVLISKCDFDMVTKHRWKKDKNGYAVRSLTKNSISMHTEILGEMPGFEIDHINMNKLDNRRENLRFVTRSQNNLNRPTDPRSKTGFNGINICNTGSFRVRVSNKEFGRYKTLKEAIKVRQAAINQIFKAINNFNNQ